MSARRNLLYAHNRYLLLLIFQANLVADSGRAVKKLMY
jgi:hypothetical protein